jgi:hypothetical protein
MRWSRICGNPCLWAFLVAEAWKPPLQPSIHLLPEAVQAAVFDMQVNAGGNVIKILQRFLGPYTAAASNLSMMRLEPIWWTPTGLPVAIITSALVIAAQPHGNTPEPAGAGRGVGSNELRNLFNQSIT